MITTEANKQEYMSVIYAGCYIESNGVSICNLEDHLRSRMSVPRAKYQVCSDRIRFHALFYTLEEAVDKFIELKHRKR
jgi:hypothetical protein